MSSTTADQNHDASMVKIMGIVMGALVVLTLLCAVAARMLGIGDYDETDTLMRNAMLERIQPVGQVRTELADVDASAAAPAAVAELTGAELVQGACAACHMAGVANAPKLDDAEAWAARRELGLEALVASVVNGKGAMPARGGSAYSDEEIQRAVESLAGF